MQKTAGETFFEQFCRAHEVRWEPDPTKASSGEKTPDYAIYPRGTKGIAEATEFQESPTERQQREHLERVGWSTFGSGKVGNRARDIIGTAAKQLKPMAKGKCPALMGI